MLDGIGGAHPCMYLAIRDALVFGQRLLGLRVGVDVQEEICLEQGSFVLYIVSINHERQGVACVPLAKYGRIPMSNDSDWRSPSPEQLP